MIERDMEDLIATYPTDFFPHHTFVLVERQSSFAGVGRFDLLFKDDHDSTMLMELKARTLKYEDATQVARYRDELKRNGHKNIVMWLVAPQIPTSVREFLDDKGIEYSEFHFGQFRRVAERHSFIIKSEAESSSQSGPSKVPENKNQSRQPRGLCSSQQGISLVPKGPLVTSGSALRWSARGRDLQLQNVDALDCAKFDSLLDAFSHAVRSKKNSSVVRNLRAWAASPRYSVLSSATIESLLRWALNESNWKANAQDAFEVWKFLFGSPAPTWKNWDELEKRYELDSNGWQQWYASL